MSKSIFLAGFIWLLFHQDSGGRIFCDSTETADEIIWLVGVAVVLFNLTNRVFTIIFTMWQRETILFYNSIHE